MKKIMTPLALLMLSMGAQAATVQNEVTGGYSDQSDESDLDTWNLGFKHYINGVNTNNGPYDLNGFLSHQSYFEAGISSNDFVDVYSLGGRFITGGDWVFGASYANSELDDFKVFGEDDIDTYRLEGGKYLANGTLLLGHYQRQEMGDFDADTFGATIEHFVPLAGQGGLMVKGGLSNTDLDFGDDVFVAEASADYFFNQGLSVGAGITSVDADSDFQSYVATGRFDSSYEVRGSYWFNPQANLKASVEKTDGIDGVLWGVQGTYRF